ncbi:MAG: hypothetical protein SF066_22965 [Thermoanaerobaculia bacterium]|nr:hypothetical protein [Thermoanaerobaculia bacterium]
MPLGDKKRQLDEQVAAAVRQAVEELQQEVRSRLHEATENLQRSIGAITPRLPESFLAEDDLRSMTDEAAAAARAEALAQQVAATPDRAGIFTELRGGIASLDRASSQAEVLQALLTATRPYAARAALFLVRGGRALGWGSRGFSSDDPIRTLTFDAGSSPWADLAADGESGAGQRELSTAESAAIASALESALPHRAVLIALVLRDRVAAVLYADQIGDGELETAALQILAYSASNALETQPLRTRKATATLVSGGVAAATAAIVVADHLPEPEEVAEPAALAEPEVIAEPEPMEPELPALAPEPEPASALPAWAAIAAPEPALPELDPEPAPPLVSAETEAWPLPSADDFAAVEAELPATPSFDDVELPAEAAPAWTDPGTGFDLEPLPVTSAPTLRYEIAALTAQPAAAAEPEVELPALSPELPSLSGFADFSDTEDGSLELIEEPPAPARPSLAWEDPDLEPVAALPEPELTPEPIRPPVVAAETVMVPTIPSPPVILDEPAPVAPDLTAAPAGGVGGQVAPPPDLDGPGWAFSTTSVPISDKDQRSHDEARRLARLLVSEILLYNQDEVEKGRQHRDICDRLRDDIDRSRQLYEERVDPVIRDSADYFYQELVRQLAAGDARALGI